MSDLCKTAVKIIKEAQVVEYDPEQLGWTPQEQQVYTEKEAPVQTMDNIQDLYTRVTDVATNVDAWVGYLSQQIETMNVDLGNLSAEMQDLKPEVVTVKQELDQIKNPPQPAAPQAPATQPQSKKPGVMDLWKQYSPKFRAKRAQEESDKCEICNKVISQEDIKEYQMEGGEGVPAVCSDCAEKESLVTGNRAQTNVDDLDLSHAFEDSDIADLTEDFLTGLLDDPDSTKKIQHILTDVEYDDRPTILEEEFGAQTEWELGPSIDWEYLAELLEREGNSSVPARKAQETPKHESILHYTKEIKEWADSHGLKVQGKEPRLDNSHYIAQWNLDPGKDRYDRYDDYLDLWLRPGDRIEIEHFVWNRETSDSEVKERGFIPLNKTAKTAATNKAIYLGDGRFTVEWKGREYERNVGTSVDDAAITEMLRAHGVGDEEINKVLNSDPPVNFEIEAGTLNLKDNRRRYDPNYDKKESKVARERSEFPNEITEKVWDLLVSNRESMETLEDLWYKYDKEPDLRNWAAIMKSHLDGGREWLEEEYPELEGMGVDWEALAKIFMEGYPNSKKSKSGISRVVKSIRAQSKGNWLENLSPFSSDLAELKRGNSESATMIHGLRGTGMSDKWRVVLNSDGDVVIRYSTYVYPKYKWSGQSRPKQISYGNDPQEAPDSIDVETNIYISDSGNGAGVNWLINVDNDRVDEGGEVVLWDDIESLGDVISEVVSRTEHIENEIVEPSAPEPTFDYE